MHEPKDLKNATRKAYTRPTLAKVPLRPEEAVLGGCKADTAGRNVGSGCLIPTPCSNYAVS